MITWGFVPAYGDAVTIGNLFIINGVTFCATYIAVGGAGDIVWENAQGEPQWFPNAQAGQIYILGARRILASGTVNGNSRVTTATLMSWLATTPLFNAP
jgi:hypothetical protein